MNYKFLLFLIQYNIGMLEILDYLRLEVDVCSFHFYVFKREVGQAVNVVLRLYVEESVAFTFAVAHYDMVRVGEGRVFSAFQVIELCPRCNEDEILDRSLYVLHCDIFISLRCVRAHLEPEEIVGL